ncbi:helix-turn-helix domain-containing protein [Winogradskyella sp.]|uniref:helix-turn-helix domain-containing protein n=1 Tax=Winogradskyella sp. TaxID=1883156 RepID=UPI003BAB09D4
MGETKEIIGRNLKAIRERMGFSQDSLADALGIARSNIANFESGRRMIPLVHIPKLAALLGIKPNDLLVKDESQIELNEVFAFKADNITKDDLKSISDFKKIVSNYLELVDKSNL